jgi:hypothetical protein
MFDPQSFLDMTVDGTNDTKKQPVPVGDYQAIVDKVDCRTWQSKADPSKSGLTLDVTWSIEDQGVKDLMGRDKVTVRQGIMLDLTEAGGLDMGKGRNLGLGRLREAVGLNVPGQPFSFTMLTGRMALVNVSHRVDGEDVYDEVKKVAKL